MGGMKAIDRRLGIKRISVNMIRRLLDRKDIVYGNFVLNFVFKSMEEKGVVRHTSTDRWVLTGKPLPKKTKASKQMLAKRLRKARAAKKAKMNARAGKKTRAGKKARRSRK